MPGITPLPGAPLRPGEDASMRPRLNAGDHALVYVSTSGMVKLQ